MKRTILMVTLLFLLALVNAALAVDASPAVNGTDGRIIELNKKLDAIDDGLVATAAEANVRLREGLESIASKIPQAQKQHVSLALVKLADAEEGLKSAKNVLALARVQSDMEHRKKMEETFSKIMENIVNLHREIYDILEDLQEKLELSPSKPSKNGERATG